MFWVTDDFLMHQAGKKSRSNRLNPKGKARYRHVRLPRNESDSDVVLSTDEEILGEIIQQNRPSVLS